MSDRDLYLSSGPDLWGVLLGLLIIAAFFTACWVVVHPVLTYRWIRTVWRRGRDYRRRLRAARHRQRRDSLRHVTFRTPVR